MPTHDAPPTEAQEDRRRNEFYYSAHLQRLLTFIVLGVSTFFAELQLSLIAEPLSHTSREYGLVIVSTFILAAAAFWALFSALAEFHLVTQLGVKVGIIDDERRLAENVQSISGAALRLRFLSERELPRDSHLPPNAQLGTWAELIAFTAGTLAIILPFIYAVT